MRKCSTVYYMTLIIEGYSTMSEFNYFNGLKYYSCEPYEANF